MDYYQRLLAKVIRKQTTATGYVNKQKCRIVIDDEHNYFACLTDLDNDDLLGRISNEKWKKLYNMNDKDRKKNMIVRTTVLDTHIEKCELCATWKIRNVLFYGESPSKAQKKVFSFLRNSCSLQRIWEKHIQNDSKKLSPGYVLTTKWFIYPFKKKERDKLHEYDMCRWETVHMQPFHRSRYEQFNQRMELQNKTTAIKHKLKKHDPTNPHYSLIMDMVNDDEEHNKDFQKKVKAILEDSWR